MTVARRLVAGALVAVSAMLIAIVIIAGARLRDRLVVEKIDELTRDARVIATAWAPGVDADSLAHTVGRALGYRVTLIDTSGAVVGDAEFGRDAVRRLENHAGRPEVVMARREGIGTARRVSASAGDEELYVALRHTLGFVRVSLSTHQVDLVVSGARRDVLVSGLVALAGVLALVVVFARSITRPIVELRDVARSIASGDLTRRPALTAPGEIGDLATALHRMSEQLAQRLQSLEEDDQLMTALLESLEEGILAVGERGQVLRMNDRARAMLNIQAAVPFDVHLLPRDSVMRTAIDQAIAGEVMSPEEISIFDRTIAVASRPLPTSGAVVTLLDLTVLRRLETIRRDFVANVSHELKTPLTAVNGFAETLLDDSIPPEQRRRFAETIRDNAMRMQRIVDDLLDLSRIESGGWRLRLAAIDVSAVVGEIFATVQSTASAKGLELSAEIPADAARVNADPTAFRQIVTNLIENAVRYTREGAVTLTTRGGSGGTWMDVHDTGVGIAPEHLPRIFERFYRVDAGRSREQGGTGLGLAIVRHLIDAHGGRVDAASVVGRGTTISVFFPSAVES